MLNGNNDWYEIDNNNTCGYSIRCDVQGKGDMDYIKFSYDNTVVDEFGLPRWMNMDSYTENGWINPVPYLASPGNKKLKVEGYIWSQKCFEQTFKIKALCDKSKDKKYEKNLQHGDSKDNGTYKHYGGDYKNNGDFTNNGDNYQHDGSS